LNRWQQPFALARYNPDGSLDHSFGSGGKVLTDFLKPLCDPSGFCDFQENAYTLAL
jgi:hypothetical protein